MERKVRYVRPCQFCGDWKLIRMTNAIVDELGIKACDRVIRRAGIDLKTGDWEKCKQ